MLNTPHHPRRSLYHEKAANAAARAAKAGGMAEELERRAGETTGTTRHMYLRCAAIHRRNQARQLAAVALYDRHLRRMSESVEIMTRHSLHAPPRLIGTVAESIGATGAYMTLETQSGIGPTLATIGVAQAALAAESAAGEGPAHACLVQGALRADAGEMESRWSIYGAALKDLHVGSVASVPLTVEDMTLGCLTALHSPSADQPKLELPQMCLVGGGVAEILMFEADDVPSDRSGFLSDLDFGACLQQAAAMVAVQMRCPISDASALLRARAFSTATDLESLAQAVISGDVDLES